MSTVKEISIKNAGGTYDTNPVGAEAQYVEVSRDSNGDIIKDITAAGVTVSSTEGLAETLKNLEKSVADSNEFSEMTDVNFTSLANNNVVQYDSTSKKWKNVAMDTTPTASSNKPVTSGGVKTALDAKQNTLTFDNTPTKNSNNPVKSGGVYTEVNSLKETLTNQVNYNGAKNLFDIKSLIRSPLQAGINFQLNDDGSVTIDGGTTNDEFLLMNGYSLGSTPIPYKPNTKYIFSIGNNKRQSELYLQVYVRETASTQWHALKNVWNVDSVEFTTPSTIFDIWVRVEVQANKSITTTTIYPMVRIAFDTDDTYVPFAMSNKELTETVETTGVTYIASENERYTDISSTSKTAVWKKAGTTIVNVRLKCVNPTAISGGEYQMIGRIPDVFGRPPVAIFHPCENYINGDTLTPMMIEITTSGDIAVRGGIANGIYATILTY